MEQNFSDARCRRGWVEVVVGCMFSGKTEELIRQVRRAQIARLQTQVFKPRIDSRYSEDCVASHNKTMLNATPVETSAQILERVLPSTAVVGIDEAQFFDEGIVSIVTQLADSGKRVIVAGLDTDWKARPFGPIPELMAIAEAVRKQYAICVVCGEPATRTQRIVAADADILVGSSESYEARCRQHFAPEVAEKARPLGLAPAASQSLQIAP